MSLGVEICVLERGVKLVLTSFHAELLPDNVKDRGNIRVSAKHEHGCPSSTTLHAFGAPSSRLLYQLAELFAIRQLLQGCVNKPRANLLVMSSRLWKGFRLALSQDGNIYSTAQILILPIAITDHQTIAQSKTTTNLPRHPVRYSYNPHRQSHTPHLATPPTCPPTSASPPPVVPAPPATSSGTSRTSSPARKAPRTPPPATPKTSQNTAPENPTTTSSTTSGNARWK